MNQLERVPNHSERARSGRGRLLPWIPIVLALLYGASPIDLIPDVLILLGFVDDAVIAGISLIASGIWQLVQRKRRPA